MFDGINYQQQHKINQLSSKTNTISLISGLWRIDIRNNHLYSVPEMAFAGLERSLGELYLPFNRLQRVPQKALQNLEKFMKGRRSCQRGKGTT